MKFKTTAIIALAAVVATYVVLVGVGAHLITSSEPYPLAKQALGEQLQNMDEGATSSFKWWYPWSFSDGASTGKAYFVLCTRTDRCFSVAAKKESGKWTIANINER